MQQALSPRQFAPVHQGDGVARIVEEEPREIQQRLLLGIVNRRLGPPTRPRVRSKSVTVSDRFVRLLLATARSGSRGDGAGVVVAVVHRIRVIIRSDLAVVVRASDLIGARGAAAGGEPARSRLPALVHTARPPPSHPKRPEDTPEDVSHPRRPSPRDVLSASRRARGARQVHDTLLAQDGVREVEHASGRGDRVHRRGPPVAVVHPERLDHQDAAHARRRDAYRRSSGQARPLQLALDPSLAEPRGERGAARYRSRPLDDVRLGAQEHQVVRIEMGQPDTRHGYRAPLPRTAPRASVGNTWE